MDKTVSVANTKEARKKDALALAELIYDMYKEEQQIESDKIVDGQNNAERIEIN